MCILQESAEDILRSDPQTNDVKHIFVYYGIHTISDLVNSLHQAHHVWDAFDPDAACNIRCKLMNLLAMCSYVKNTALQEPNGMLFHFHRTCIFLVCGVELHFESQAFFSASRCC